MKTYTDSYLYNKFPEYQKSIVEFLVKGERLNINDKEFEDIVYEFKHRQIADYLYKILKSPKVVLIIAPKAMPRSL